jgi:hypothetical protein
MKSLEMTGRRIALLAAVGALWACDIPTDTPKLEQEWILPIAGTSVEVVEFLPDDVVLTDDESAFAIQMDPIDFRSTLGDLCAACIILDGLTVPKPVFVGDFHETIFLPGEVESAQVQEGRIVVEARNRFGFDPLRPPGGETGTFSLALHDGGPDGPILDEVVIDGDDTSFGPGALLSRDLEYSGPVGSSISVTVTVNSPAGGPEPGNWVPIRINDEIEVTATSEVLEAESAEITVAGDVFDLGVTNLDVVDISKDLVEKVRAGSFELEIVNPWSVGAILNLTIDGPTMDTPLILIAPVPPVPISTVEVEFSQAELQAFLGEPNVTLAGQGTVNQDADPVTLAPGQVMLIDTRLDLVILIG